MRGDLSDDGISSAFDDLCELFGYSGKCESRYYRTLDKNPAKLADELDKFADKLERGKQ